MDADGLAELLRGGTLALQSIDDWHQVSIVFSDIAEAEAVMEALERIASDRC